MGRQSRPGSEGSPPLAGWFKGFRGEGERGLRPEGCSRLRAMFIKSALHVIRTYPQPCRAAPFRSGNQKEGPFMGRLRANFARLGNPMQDCHQRKEPALRAFLFLPDSVIPSRRRRIPVGGKGRVSHLPLISIYRQYRHFQQNSRLRRLPLWWLTPPPFPRKRGHYGRWAFTSYLRLIVSGLLLISIYRHFR